MLKPDAVIKLLMLLIGLLAGFGTSEMAIVKEVHKASADIDNLRRELTEEKTRTDVRINSVVSSINTLVSQNTELITLIRVQQQQIK